MAAICATPSTLNRLLAVRGRMVVQLVINNTTVKISTEVVEIDGKPAQSVEGQEANGQSISTSQEAVVEKGEHDKWKEDKTEEEETEEQSLDISNSNHSKEPGGSVPKTPRSNPHQEIKDRELKEDFLNVQIDQVSRAAYLSPRQTRSVNTQQSFERLTNLNRRNRYSIIGLMEPFEDAEQIERFRRKLEDEQGSVEIENEQQITLKLFHQSLNCNIVLTVVYASCDAGERRVLWDSINQVSNLFYLPWLVGGDFNVISTEKEKLGGLLVLYNEVADFNHCLSSCGLQDLRYVGSTYTWWNGRAEEACIFKRLDRMVCNDKFLDVMPTMKVTHLIKKGSDHSHLEHKFSTTTEVIIKSFKFLNFLVQHESFQEVITQHWCIDFEGNPFTKFHHKLKKVKDALRIWSKNTYGNIFQQIASLEEKSRLTWFQDGDRKSKFFHAYVKGRRKKLRVDNIQDADGNWLTNQEEISQEAVRCYQKQFEEDIIPSKFGLLKHIPTLVTEDQNHTIEMLPNEEEVKEVVFALNGESACGPDGFTGLFFQSAWEIVKLDVVDMAKAFFVGQELPRFITHTNLILIPKKEQVQSFSDLRPISLSYFTNKIISRVLHERLVKLLPGLISEKQSAFVKGRSIMENVLLTQEIARDISKRTKTANVVVKLDMTKDITYMIESLGSSSPKLLSNNWYSVLLNGQAHGFFKSSRGVKQGDPLSPTLFILAAEALSRGLNALYKNPRFVEYGMPKWTPRINHLSYVDDTILFISADQYSVKLMMKVLNRYEKVRSCLVSRMKQITGIRQGLFPFTYLGCPIFYSRNIISDYETVVKKIAKRVNAWQGRLLSYGGRATLISHVLQSMHVYLLSGMNPPKGMIRQMHSIFSRFFLSNTGDKKGVHWVKWETLPLPKDEGGLGFKSLFEVSNALFCRLWWNLRTNPSLWSSFIINKYNKKLHPVIAHAKEASSIWRKLIIVRELVEHQIWWQVKKGDSSF
ncbi:uncharacterized protein LOC132619837 [Lycium barbarum]|uniref:uncharacterized protein LOC132619837 n=1 Tax=Lycium barbarum TaxID=112863 RepID=UPI00293E33D0|nr:uncharacterized protein LOC132619837 [Lycium barbarum]